MKAIYLLLACFVVCARTQNSRFNKKTNKGKFTEAMREHSGSTYRLLAGRNNSENVIYSPLSIYLTMGMLLEGARENSADELRRAMRLVVNSRGRNISDSRVHRLMEKLYGNTMRRRGGPILRVANGLFVQEGFDIKPTYTHTLTDSYRAKLEILDFGDSSRAANRINNWVANVTENRITDLVNPSSLSFLTRVVITNAIYFNATWQFPFIHSNTTTFTRSDKTQVTARFIEVTGYFRATTRNNIRFVAIPYNSTSRLKTFLVLGIPTEEGDLSSLSRIGADRIFGKLYLNNNWNFERVHVVIPEFQVSQEVDLKEEVLQRQGVSDIFRSDASNLNGISEQNIYVTEYRHKAFINVNQIGTEAAAASFVIIAGRSGGGPAEFVADVPFFFGIYDAKAEVYTFMGKIEDPTVQE